MDYEKLLQVLVSQQNALEERIDSPSDGFEMLNDLGPRERLIWCALNSQSQEAQLAGASSERERRLQEKLDLALEHLEEVLRLNRMLAAGVGACPECWGEDPDCDCGGQRPGVGDPDPMIFRELVLPAMHRWKVRDRTQPSRPNDSKTKERKQP